MTEHAASSSAELYATREPALADARPVAVHDYRADIDGLRAIAVLSVVLFHIGFFWVGGGYVGVDVFFVISGYLIGGAIDRDLAARRFSYATFYAKRIGRILPAFAAMTLVVTVACCVIFYPPELIRYARSMIAASASVSNLFFLSQAGYFDESSAHAPLLHTWSLGVEEQFYLLFPLLLGAIARFGGGRLRHYSLLAVLVASFIANIVLIGPAPDQTFYGLHTRAWELLLGTMVALWPAPGLARRPLLREALAVLGLVLIVYPVVTYASTTPFPGWAALAPCVGTALVILVGGAGPSFVRWGLSLPPMRAVGLISYSVYLWHWPVLVFQRQFHILISERSHLLGNHPRLPANLAVLAVSLIAGGLSWAVVEQPLRKAARVQKQSRVIVAGAAFVALAAAGGLAILAAKGLPGRFSPEAVRLASYLEYDESYMRPARCFILSPYLASQYSDAECLATHPPRPAYVLLGDSHAADLWYGLSHVMADADILQASAAGCKPLLTQVPGASPECVKVVHHLFYDVLPAHKDMTVILAARWEARDLPGVAATLDRLKAEGHRVVLIGPNLEFEAALPGLLARAEDLHAPDLPLQRRVEMAELDGALSHLAQRAGVPYASIDALLCRPDSCPLVLGPSRVPIEFDDNHLTREGSVLAAQDLVAAGLFH